MFALSRRQPGRRIIDHVEAAPALRATGAAAQFMAGLADKARADGHEIIPVRAHAAGWFHRRPETHDFIG